MLFDNISKHSVALPRLDAAGHPTTMGALIKYICEHLIKDPRKELFVLDGSM